MPYGIAEARLSFTDSLGSVGKQDKRGETILIAYTRSLGLDVVPLILRALGFVALLSLILVRQPFSWLPVQPGASAWLVAIRDWEAFSLLGWSSALVIYLAYFCVCLVNQGFYRGVEGMDLHFTKHTRMVKKLLSGEWWVDWDPRVRPFAAVSTKITTLPMKPVTGTSKDNIRLVHRGAFLIRVTDSFRLLREGGLSKFLEQIDNLYASVIKDRILQIRAQDFRQFLIEPARLPDGADQSADITTKLARLETSDLSERLLTELSEIDEIDISGFGLDESPNPVRREIARRVQDLANSYGIDVLDYVPQGNMTSDEFIETLLIPLLSSIARLRQATDQLLEIRKEEIDEEIMATVATKRLGVLEVHKIIQEINAVTAVLQNEQNAAAIVESRRAAIENITEARLAAVTSQIESQLARVQSMEIGATGLERYMAELDGIYTDLEREVDGFAPEISTVVTDQVDPDTILPRVDVVDLVLDKTGTTTALEQLRSQIEEDEARARRTEAALREIEEATRRIDIADSMETLESELAKVTSSTGVSTEKFSVDNVKKMIDHISEKAGIDTDADDSQIAAAEASAEGHRS